MFHANSRTSGHVSVVRVFSRQSRVNAQAVCSARGYGRRNACPTIRGRIHTRSAAVEPAAIETAAITRYTARYARASTMSGRRSNGAIQGRSARPQASRSMSPTRRMAFGIPLQILREAVMVPVVHAIVPVGPETHEPGQRPERRIEPAGPEGCPMRRLVERAEDEGEHVALQHDQGQRPGGRPKPPEHRASQDRHAEM